MTIDEAKELLREYDKTGKTQYTIEDLWRKTIRAAVLPIVADVDASGRVLAYKVDSALVPIKVADALGFVGVPHPTDANYVLAPQVNGYLLSYITPQEIGVGDRIRRQIKDANAASKEKPTRYVVCRVCGLAAKILGLSNFLPQGCKTFDKDLIVDAVCHKHAHQLTDSDHRKNTVSRILCSNLEFFMTGVVSTIMIKDA